MRIIPVLPLLLLAAGAVLAGIAFVGPFGNTGVDLTLGAGLALLGSVAATLLAGIATLAHPRRGWRKALIALAVLAALLTALAAVFLMQTLLAAAMLAGAAGLIAAPFFERTLR
ncbi:MAG: hypothetical protein ACK4IA_10760 [Paracoccus hibiscisoli]|uniref:hypothetical protein n=1 Tax=Paracoccus hibiscisoli TaxID=2023261 RepID=UPI00391A3CCB